MLGWAIILLGFPLGMFAMVGGARLSERTRWGYGVMAVGIAYAAYGAFATVFLVAFARAMKGD